MRNKFPGKCFRCDKPVPEKTGHFQRMAGRWVLRCKACVGKGNERVRDQSVRNDK